MTIKNPTMRKLLNRGLQPIRYHNGQQWMNGYIVSRDSRGTMTVRLIGENRNRKLSAAEARYVKELR